MPHCRSGFTYFTLIAELSLLNFALNCPRMRGKKISIKQHTIRRLDLWRSDLQCHRSFSRTVGLPSPGAAESTKPSQVPKLHVFRLYGDDSDVGRHRKSLIDEKIEDDEYKYDRCFAC